MTDPIADMLTRIRNAAAAGNGELVLPMSRMKMAIAKILEAEGWVQKCEELEGGENGKAFKEMKIVLKYKKSGRPAISSIKRISKPGLRIYHGKNDLPVVLGGLGIAIVSTSQGIMTVKEARGKKLGGEIICEIY
ncbi:MAG: 30S ribosomal protein S8 [Patescibacteria group bacterium]|jgi:small subunit ribosomal protein S8